jgi:hypothetical protein
MLGSEDAEVLFYIQKAGWEVWYNPEMEVDHIIPASRLERSYLISLMRGVGLARHHLRMLQFARWQRPLMFFAYLGNDILKATLFFFRYRIFNNDVSTACEMERLISTAVSPFYLGKLRLQRYFDKNK